MKRKSAPPKPQSHDDLWLQQLHVNCAKAMTCWLKSAVNIERQIKTLTLPEFAALAAACEAEWIRYVSLRLLAGDMSETDRKTYSTLLM
jgi:hypothetical protein